MCCVVSTPDWTRGWGYILGLLVVVLYGWVNVGLDTLGGGGRGIQGPVEFIRCLSL